VWSRSARSLIVATVVIFGVLPACRASEEKSEASEVQPAQNGTSPAGSSGNDAYTATANPVPHSGPGAVPSLCLELLAPRSKVLVGEPVVLIVSLRNCSSTEKTVLDVLSPEYRFLTTFVTRPGQKAEVRYEPGVVRERRGKSSRRLAPGERLTAWIPLHVDRSGWFLRQPGTYGVRAVLAVEDGRIESNRVAIEVVSARNAADTRAADIFMSPEVGRSALEGATPGSKGWSSLEALVKEYPESRLAPYALLATGITRTRTVFNPATKSFQKPDCPRAVEELRTALPHLEDPLLAARGTLALSECLEALGRTGAARESVSEYSRLHPEARKLPGVADVFQSATSRSNR